MKNYLSILLALFAWFALPGVINAALISGVAFPNESEPNDTKEQADDLGPDTDASPLANAVGATGNMSSTDTDWFTFKLDTSGYSGSGSTLRLTFGCGSNSRTLAFTVFDSSDAQVGYYSSTINSSNPTRSTTMTITPTGQYFVRVTSGSSSTTYNFMFEGLSGAEVSTFVPLPAGTVITLR